MTVLSHSIPAGLVDGLQTGNDEALHHGFQEVFPTLVHAAEDELHESASAARVAEKAFLEVLAKPPAECDADSIDRAIDDAMRHALVREKSRLAALRRFEHNERVTHRESGAVPIDAERAWERIQQARHSASPETRPTTQERQHRAAVHVAEAMDRRRRWSIPLLVLAVLTLCAAVYGLTRIDPRPSETFIASELAAAAAKPFRAANGQIGNVALTDETVVKLAAGSTMKVNRNFGDPMRAATLDGAASFVVAAGDSPLELRARGVAISAPGGRLQIRSEEGKPTIVRVWSGHPRVTVGDSTWPAQDGQAFAIAGGQARPATAAEIEEAFGWMEGRFAVNGTVRDVVAGFRRWYDVDVGVGDASIADWPANVSGSLESLASSLASLEKSSGVKMSWVNRRMLLFRK